MDDFNFNKEAYLRRIEFQGKVSINFESLELIHHAQHTTIPFENFDICLGRGINLGPKALENKLVKGKRGGYCFELNGLLLLALRSFGFEARPLLGRVHITGEPTGRGHQVTLVTIDRKNWLVDLGFGSECPPIPIPLVFNQPIPCEDQTFRLIESDLYGYMLQVKHTDMNEWNNLYSVDLNHVCPGDIDYGNHFTSTSPNSFFTTARVAALPTSKGIVTLFNTQLKKKVNGKEEIIELDEDQSYLKIIEEEFGINIDAKCKDLKPLALKSI